MFRTRFKLPHPSIAGIHYCVCTHPIDPIGIHLLCCIHGNERMGTHDAVCNIFVTIAQNVNFHIRQEQLHALPSTTFNSSYQQVHIVLTKDGNCTLANIVIADPT